MIGKFVFLAALVAAVTGGRAPNADKLESFKKTPLGSKFSDDVYREAQLDVPGLIAKNGYPVETHVVTTADGYILQAHRIPHGKNRNNQPGPRPVIFLMHGLLSSSADYVVLGPENALAYVLAEEGYDVWMGNARGNFYSRNHIRFDPDRSTSFWLFSWEEIGLYDIPAYVDYILNVTGESKMQYVGHSQGGTVFFVLNSLKPEYNDKFVSFQGLAPAAFFTHNEHPTYNTLAQYEKILETTALTFGLGEILTNEQYHMLVAWRMCDGQTVFEPACLEIVANTSTMANVDQEIIPLLFSHAPAGASIRQVAHYGQCIARDAFARFNYNPITNLIIYGRMTPPEFDLSKVTVPSYLFYGLNDHEVDYRDVHKLTSKLGNVVEVIRAERDTFNHFDFIWAKDVKSQIYDDLLKRLRASEARFM